MNYYIADPHLGHTNVLKFDNRPFDNIEDHDKEIIERWNKTVGVDDDIYILGDISWYNSTKTIQIYSGLNGIKHLIIGNHDKKLLRNRELRDLFVEITDYKEISFDDGKGLILCHYPIPCFNHHYYGWYHFYGHVHNSQEWGYMELIRRELVEHLGKPCNMINVGCMMPYMDYTPRTLTEIIDGYNKFEKDLMKCLR